MNEHKTAIIGDIRNGVYIKLSAKSKCVHEKVGNPAPADDTGELVVMIENVKTSAIRWIPVEQRVYLAEEYN